MQNHQDRPDYPSVGDPSFPLHPDSGGAIGTGLSALEPYTPPNVPHGLPHVVRFATLSSMDLPLEVRFLIIMLSRFADVNGVASVAAATLCEICRIGSHHTVDRWLALAADVGILRKEPGQGGKDRRSNSYTFLGQERDWKSLPVGRPDINPIVALAQARRRIEDLEAQLTRIVELEAELVRLRSAAAGHQDVTNGEAGSGPPETYPSYETADPQGYGETHAAIGHSRVTDGEDDPSPEEVRRSYERQESGSVSGEHGAIGHSGVTNGEGEPPPEEASHSYETEASGPSQETRGAIGHSEVTDGSDEGQQYLARRERVQALVMEQRAYYGRSFRGGLLSAIEFFARSEENEADLLRQVEVLRAGQEPAESGSGPPQEREAPSVPMTASGRPEVENCPDCGSPYTTFNDEVRCPDCTYRRRREKEP